MFRPVFVMVGAGGLEPPTYRVKVVIVLNTILPKMT